MLSQRDSPGTVCSGAALGLFLKLSFLLGLPLLQPRPSHLLLLPLSFFGPHIAGSSLGRTSCSLSHLALWGKGLLKQSSSG